MPRKERDSVRRDLLAALIRKADADLYPSSTMLDVIESLLTEEDLPEYERLLLSHIDRDAYPSIPMIRRLQRFA